MKTGIEENLPLLKKWFGLVPYSSIYNKRFLFLKCFLLVNAAWLQQLELLFDDRSGYTLLHNATLRI